jgi:aerobic carbon-monoxide dehydrogenase medium subunit
LGGHDASLPSDVITDPAGSRSPSRSDVWVVEGGCTKPSPFEYAAPESLEEAVSTLSEHADDGKIIAGGQSLIPLMAFRLSSPAVLVDLNRVSELEYLRDEGARLEIGAMARHRSVEAIPTLADRCPMLSEALALIGHVAIRNRGTVGGSLAHADPTAEWGALLLALDGEVEATGPRGVRTISCDEFFITHFTTALQADEIITRISLPLPTGPRVGSAFLELSRRHGDFAVAGAAAVLEMAEDGTVARARAALIGARDTPVRARSTEDALVNERPTDERLRHAAAAVASEIDPPSDVHGSSEDRRHLADVLMRRALMRARDRAGAGGD